MSTNGFCNRCQAVLGRGRHACNGFNPAGQPCPCPGTHLTGEELRDAGMARASSHSGYDEWYDEFEKAGMQLLRAGWLRITAEDIMSICGPQPGHHNQIGTAMRTFASQHYLKDVDTTKAVHPDGHARKITVWAVK